MALRPEREGCVNCLKAEPFVLLSQKCQGPCRDMRQEEEGVGEFPREWECKDPEGKSPGTWLGAWERGSSKPALGLAHPEPAAGPGASEGQSRHFTCLENVLGNVQGQCAAVLQLA